MEQDKSVQEFMRLLAENGREGQARDFSALLFYMDGMERQYNAVLQELQEVKQQLAEMNVRPSPARKALDNLLNKLEARLEALGEQMSAIREKISVAAKEAVENFKDKGVSALDKAMSALRLKPALEKVQEGLQRCVSDASAAIGRGEAVGAELRNANRHIKNALYAAIGRKPPPQIGKSGRFQAAVLSPMRGLRNVLSKMNNSALGAISAVERLERTAEQMREKRAEKKPSLRAELEASRKEAAARADAHEKEKKPREAER